MSNIPGYKETAGNVFIREEGDKKWVYAYNGTGSARSNGYVCTLSMFDDTDGYYPKLLAVAANAIACSTVCVVENSAAGKGSIASDEWGWVQVRGLCTVTTAASITDEHCAELRADAAGVASTEGDSTLTANTFAIAKEAGTDADSVSMYLLGRENVVIAAS